MANDQATSMDSTQIERYLRGLAFPATVESIVAKAEENGADEETVDFLRGLPEIDYESMADVTEAIEGSTLDDMDDEDEMDDEDDMDDDDEESDD